MLIQIKIKLIKILIFYNCFILGIFDRKNNVNFFLKLFIVLKWLYFLIVKNAFLNLKNVYFKHFF